MTSAMLSCKLMFENSFLLIYGCAGQWQRSHIRTIDCAFYDDSHSFDDCSTAEVFRKMLLNRTCSSCPALIDSTLCSAHVLFPSLENTALLNF
jgi:hypothetical protein